MTNRSKPTMSVEVVVLARSGLSMTLLVARRAYLPYAGELALPGGFVEPFELPLDAALRELTRETGLELSAVDAVPLSLRARKGRDPRGWTISQPFLFWVDAEPSVRGQDPASETFWVPLAQLPSLVFDHGAILCEALGCFWQIMPGGVPALRQVRAFGVPEYLPAQPVFFGGTFNPWHKGHQNCVAMCPQPADVLVVPDTNPFKGGPGERCYWSLYRDLYRRVHDLGAHVYPGFCGREQANPTARWLPYVNRDDKALLVGEDTLADMPNWMDAVKVVQAVSKVIAVPRRVPADQIRNACRWLEDNGCEVERLGDHPYRDVSSTQIRQR